MENQDCLLPPFLPAPAGIDPMEHLPTIEARIRYWEAVRTFHPKQARTASSLQTAYEEARQSLKTAKRRTRQIAGSLGHHGHLL